MSYNQTRQTYSKKDCDCAADCKKKIKKGDPCIVDPKNKKAFHVACYNKK